VESGIQTWAMLGMGISTLVMVVVGGRLLAAAHRTRQLPELLFGITFLGSGLGQAFAQLGMRTLWSTPGELATALNTACFGLVVLGNLALWLVTWRLYRPGSGAGASICAAGTLVTLVAYGVRILDADFVAADGMSRGYFLSISARLLLMTWVSFESFRYHAMLRRRLKLGLAEPVPTNQILLWAISGACGWVGALLIMGSLFGLGIHPLANPAIMSALVAVALVASGCMWCAFFPPKWLRRRIEASASARC